MTSLFEHNLEEVVQQEGMGLASLANTLEPMLAKFREEFSSIGDAMIKRIKNQVGRGRAPQLSRKSPPGKKISRKPPAKQVGAGKAKPQVKKPQAGKGKKTSSVKKTSFKKVPTKKRKLQANF